MWFWETKDVLRLWFCSRFGTVVELAEWVLFVFARICNVLWFQLSMLLYILFSPDLSLSVAFRFLKMYFIMHYVENGYG